MTTERTETSKIIVPHDPMAILDGLLTTEYLRDFSLEFINVVTENPEFYKGNENNFLDKADKALTHLGKLAEDSTKTGYAIYSIRDVISGLKKINDPLVRDLVDKYSKQKESQSNK
jgi:hypothetical protein